MLPVLCVSLQGLAAQSAPHAAAKPAATTARTVWPDEGPAKWAPRPTVSAITANDLRTRLYQIADDSMMGRKIGELGNYKTTAYIASEFKRLGLKPAGDNGGYFQELDYGPSAFDSTTARLTVGTKVLAARTDWIPLAPNARDPGIAGTADITNAPTVFVGAWGDTTADLAVVQGKVAVFTAGAVTGGAGGRGGRGAGRGGAGGRTVPRCDSLVNNFGADNALKAAAVAGTGRGGRGGRGGAGGAANSMGVRLHTAGAVAVLIVSLDSTSANTVNNIFNRRAMAMEVAPSTRGVPQASISSEAAAAIFGKPVEQLAKGATGQPVSGSWNYQFHKSATPARNVVAILPGSNPALAGEYVLVSAHNDHNGVNAVAVDHDSLRAFNWVTKPQGANDPACRPSPTQQHEIDSMIARARSIRPPRRDSIMNGADDDGSGTVVLLEIAEQFAVQHPQRSIIFVSHTGEEAGLLGSKWFTDHPTIPLDSVVAAHNMDMLGKGRVDEVKFGGPTSVQTLGARRLSREFGDIIDSVNATRSETMAIDKSWDITANPMNRFCRSDQVNYVHHNVPVTYFSLGYGPDYHQPTDEPQYVDYDHAARLARFIHDVMWAIANRKDKPAISGPDASYPSCG
jgi:hypothetical protein